MFLGKQNKLHFTFMLLAAAPLDEECICAPAHIEIDNACKQGRSQSLNDDDDETYSMSDVHSHSLTYLIFVNFGKLPHYLAL